MTRRGILVFQVYAWCSNFGLSRSEFVMERSCKIMKIPYLFKQPWRDFSLGRIPHLFGSICQRPFRGVYGGARVPMGAAEWTFSASCGRHHSRILQRRVMVLDIPVGMFRVHRHGPLGVPKSRISLISEWHWPSPLAISWQIFIMWLVHNHTGIDGIIRRCSGPVLTPSGTLRGIVLLEEPKCMARFPTSCMRGRFCIS